MRWKGGGSRSSGEVKQIPIPLAEREWLQSPAWYQALTWDEAFFSKYFSLFWSFKVGGTSYMSCQWVFWFWKKTSVLKNHKWCKRSTNYGIWSSLRKTFGMQILTEIKMPHRPAIVILQSQAEDVLSCWPNISKRRFPLRRVLKAAPSVQNRRCEFLLPCAFSAQNTQRPARVSAAFAHERCIMPSIRRWRTRTCKY